MLVIGPRSRDREFVESHIVSEEWLEGNVTVESFGHTTRSVVFGPKGDFFFLVHGNLKNSPGCRLM